MESDILLLTFETAVEKSGIPIRSKERLVSATPQRYTRRWGLGFYATQVHSLVWAQMG